MPIAALTQPTQNFRGETGVSKTRPFQAIPRAYRRDVVMRPVLIFIAGLILTTVILYITVSQPIGPSYGEGFRMLAQLQQDILSKSTIIYAITVFIIVCGILLLTLIYSHRIAGPVYRLTHFAMTLCSGDFSSKVHIREKDVIHPLADDMNNMVEQYRQTLNNLQDEIQSLDQLAVQVEDRQDEDKMWTDIEEGAGKIISELERYTI